MSPIKHWSHFWVCLHIVSLSHTHHSHVLLYIYKTEVKPANTSWVGCFNAVFLLHTRANLDQFLKKYVTRSSTNRRAHVSLLLVMLLAERARSSSKPEPLIASVTPRPAQGQSHYLRGKQIDSCKAWAPFKALYPGITSSKILAADLGSHELGPSSLLWILQSLYSQLVRDVLHMCYLLPSGGS